jgi:hypothetical protein
MFRFHEYGTEAGDCSLGVGVRGIFPGVLWKKRYRKFGKGEVEVAFGGFVEDSLGESGRSLRGGGADGPEDDVQLRRKSGTEEVRGFGEALMQFKCGGVTGFQTLSKDAAGSVREELLRGPESDRGGTGARALEGDFAEVEFL